MGVLEEGPKAYMYTIIYIPYTQKYIYSIHIYIYTCSSSGFVPARGWIVPVTCETKDGCAINQHHFVLTVVSGVSYMSCHPKQRLPTHVQTACAVEHVAAAAGSRIVCALQSTSLLPCCAVHCICRAGRTYDLVTFLGERCTCVSLRH